MASPVVRYQGLMPRLLASLLFVACAGLAAAAGAGSSDETSPTSTGTGTTTATTGAGGQGGAGGTGGAGGAGGSAPDPSALCAELSLPVRPFSAGPFGTHRGEIADDFTLELMDGSSFNLHERYSGCESYVFVPDRLPISDLDPTSVWEKDADLASLVKQSPENVHYFFVSRLTDDAEALASAQAMQGRIEALLATLDAADAAHWKERLHVGAKKALDLTDWVGDVLDSHGRIGFGIDRLQKIRGAGYLADVTRYSSQLEQAGAWPWKSNLAYAAHEPEYYNAQALLQERVDAEDATVVTLFDGEILEELADTQVTLPSAAEMAAFDTFEIEVTQQCPDPDEIELGNCGAWDYIASLLLDDGAQSFTELARFITSYHRETHWVVDVSQMLPLLKDGGARTFRWSFAPSWNTQPTATKLSLRFSNQAKGMSPTQATFLWSGGGFGSQYNLGHAPVDVPIPATAQKVELWTIITGHGAGTSQCSEFCNHQHEFTVNGAVHLKEFPGAGTNQGCIAELEHGMTPNQAGTWWFGRGGWCPGQQVDPWVVDVTADVVPGQTATLSYRGLFNDIDPPPDGAGDIAMVSYLVVHE